MATDSNRSTVPQTASTASTHAAAAPPASTPPTHTQSTSAAAARTTGSGRTAPPASSAHAQLSREHDKSGQHGASALLAGLAGNVRGASGSTPHPVGSAASVSGPTASAPPETRHTCHKDGATRYRQHTPATSVPADGFSSVAAQHSGQTPAVTLATTRDASGPVHQVKTQQFGTYDRPNADGGTVTISQRDGKTCWDYRKVSDHGSHVQEQLDLEGSDGYVLKDTRKHPDGGYVSTTDLHDGTGAVVGHSVSERVKVDPSRIQFGDPQYPAELLPAAHGRQIWMTRNLGVDGWIVAGGAIVGKIVYDIFSAEDAAHHTHALQF